MLKSYLQGSVFGREYGVGNPAALALHGWRRSHEDWAPLLNGLPALALDLPGFGASPPPPGAWGSAEYAEFLSPLLDAFPDIQILVGHSFGGRIAVQLAARRPERFRHVILAGVPLVRVVPHPTPALSFRLMRRANQWGLISDNRMEALRRSRGSDDYKALEGTMRAVLVRTVNESYEELLERIDCEVDLVWGERDQVVPVGVCERAETLIRHCHVTVCSGEGHLGPVLRPTELRRIVTRSLEVK